MKNNQLKLLSLTCFVLWMSIYGNALVLNTFLYTASEAVFYLGQVILEILLLFITFFILKKLGKQEFFQLEKPKISYLFLVPLSYFLIIFWNSFSQVLFPTTQNQQLIEDTVTNPDTALISAILVVIVAPIYEEFVFRALLMTWLEKFRTFYIDIFISSSLFSLLHIADKGLIVSDFIHYFVLGLIFSFLYRKTKHIGYSISLHILMNGIAWLVLTFLL